jgi:hypothetical protein
MAVPYSFFEVYLAVHPKDLPSGRPQVRDRHLKFHEDRDNLPDSARPVIRGDPSLVS